ncbi:hypothetical protein HBA54_12300 [Pelagibius litoralis]|uniref:DUF5801 domain-containing protein n=1 Tax=Pelagibius litoralis TaxID=374515 RepID=A0A967K6P3_9PROT|nr:DUF5801 repeats-in-toxin domain-containing protein [Pelagibius litoralis]NIA69373.1 hypothetical protein [Pelagibius litoralis]
MTDDLSRGDEGQDGPAIEPGASAVDIVTFGDPASGSASDTTMTGQAGAAVAVSRPDAGLTVEVQALAGQSYSLDFAPGEAEVELDGADFILIFDDGSRIVFLDLVTLAESGDAPAFTVAGAEVGADVLLAQVLALAAAADTALDTAGDPGPQGGGATQYSDNLGDLLDFVLATAQGVLTPLTQSAAADADAFFPFENEIPDSIPTAESGPLIFDETPGIDGATNDAVLPAGIEGALAAAFDSGFPGAGGLPAVKGAANGTLAFDAGLNGPAQAVDFIGYADVDSGLDSGGRASPEDILLRSDPGDSRIVWGIGADSGALVFVAFIPDFGGLASGPGTADFWFVAFQPINHPIAGAQDPGATPDPFDDPVSLVLQYVVTDADGDVSPPASVTLTIEDDGPAAGLALLPGAAIVVDESLGENPGEDETASLGAVTVLGTDLFTDSADAGSDGQESKVNTLDLTAGASGLTDTASGEAVVLVDVGGIIEGRTETGGELVFTIAVDADSGDVTVTQFRALEHGDTGDADDSIGLNPGLVALIQTVTDGDGDVDSASVDLGSVISFEDDGPSVTAELNGDETLRHDEIEGLNGEDDIVFDDLSTEIQDLFNAVGNPGDDPNVADVDKDNGALGFAANPAALVTITASDFGADGPAGGNAAAATVYALAIGGDNGAVDSGLDTADGQSIFLFLQDNGVVVGRVDQDGNGSAGPTDPAAFAIAIDPASGAVYLAQWLSLLHDATPETVGEPIALAAEALQVTVTLTDGDGDQTTAAVDVGNRITFENDGPRVIDLTDLDVSKGFVIIGEAAGDQAGVSVSSAGDVNGDGFDDLIVGVPGDFFEYSNADGAAYVVFGKAGGFGPVDLANLGTGDGFVIQGLENFDRTGHSVSSAGDVNGDGFDDVIVGVPGDNYFIDPEGAAYVVFGKAGGFGPVDLSSLAVDQGFVIQGAGPGDEAGFSVSSAGDVNGDGLDDLIVGAPFSDGGAAHIVFGKTGGFGTVDLSNLDASDGFVIQGAENFDRAGLSVSSAGDVNGDGFDDLIVGANGNGANNQGAAYLVFGKAGGLTDIDLGSGLAAGEGFVIRGAAGDRAGNSVSSAGDVNGDGFDDLIIGAIGNALSGASGAAYVVFGKAGGHTDIDLGAGLTAEEGFAIQGDGAFDRTGFSVSSAGDINGDGFDDIIVGALGNPYAGSGGADYVIFGKAEGFGTIDLANGLSADEGFIIQGLDQGAYAGASVSSAGDVNGDGFDDLIVGAPAPYGTAEGYSGGAAYVIFGGAFGGAVTTTGTGGNEILIGGSGDDTLTGGGGADVFRSGAGDDLLVVGDTGFARIDGGTGFDTLALDGAGLHLDLTQVLPAEIASIEAIDLTGSGANSLTLSQLDVFDITEERSDGMAILRVTGNGDDGVTFAEIGWANAGSIAESGVTYDRYVLGNAEVRVEQGVTVSSPQIIDLTGLTVPQGFVIQGDRSGDRAGESVSSAGDVNGDGFDDLIVGAPYGDDGGEAYVVFGKAEGFGTIDLSALAPADGFIILGDMANDRAGFSVSSAGDINGDGFDDLIVGAPDGDDGGTDAGEAYVVFGKADGFGTVDLAELAPAEGFIIQGSARLEEAGLSVSSAGDVNGDGFDDLIVGVRGKFDPAFKAAYVVFGKVEGFGTVDLAELAPAEGFAIEGLPTLRIGWSVSSAGDVNGDGFDDIIVGAPGADRSDTGRAAGEAYVVFGKAHGFGSDGVVDPAALAGSGDGFVIKGAATDDWAGWSVSSAGDVNGDGFDDLIVGAFLGDDGDDENVGAAYVVFGKADGFGSDGLIDLAGLAGSGDGFVIQGAAAFDNAGRSVSSAGDVNGDGFDDLIVGAPGGDGGGDRAGEAYVVFGKADGFGSVDVTDLAADDGFVIQGAAAYDLAGWSVSSAGDVNGDGFDDLIVGAPGVLGTGNSGAAYVIFGGAFGGAVTTTGTGGNEILIGGRDNDTLTGGGGGDVIRAGAGDDLLVVADTGFARIDGGTGFDTLALDGAGLHLDLTEMLPAEIASIEAIDLTGSGANSLTLLQLDVFDITEERSGGTAILRVTGDAGDGVTFGEFGWANAGSIAEGTITYDRYVLGNAEVRVEQGVAVSFPQVIDLAGLTVPQGFVIVGDKLGDEAGTSVSSAGDVNGDGFDDIIVGAPFGDDGGDAAGEAYVVFGKASGFGTVDLSNPLDPAVGFVIVGDRSGDRAGSGVSSAGDVNGDGFDDIIVGAPGGDDGGGSAGEAYVVFGKADGFGTVDLSALTPTDGFVIRGDRGGDQAGRSVSSAGDVNGDGFDDLIVGAPFGDDGIDDQAGKAYVVFGKAGGFDTVDLTGLSAANGFVIVGDTSGDRAGWSVSSAGDVNGDGFDDLIVGAYWGDDGGGDAGEAYVVFGKASGFGTIDVTGLAASGNGFVIQGDTANDQAGYSVSSAGDVNGDGFDDLIVGARFGGDGGTTSGEAYVVFGKAGGFGTVDLSVLSPTDGFVIVGGAREAAGYSVSSAGDVNGDGFDDLIVGAARDSDGGTWAGGAYVIFGKAGGFGTVDLTSLVPADGFVIQGDAAFDRAGRSVSSAGDVNGDGFDDLIVGALYGDDGGDKAGEAYVVLGGAFGGSTTPATTVGTAGNEILIGGLGDDTLTGGGGADVIRSGAGDDLLVVSDTGFARIDGGTGFDTLALDGSGLHLDLTQVLPAEIASIEAIDLTGSGANSLTLSQLDVFDITEERSGGTAILRVTGDAGDGVTFAETGWANAGSIDEGGVTYDRYVLGNAEVRVEKGISISSLQDIDLSLLNAQQGFVIQGDAAGDQAGVSVSSAGDVNGDGFDDIIVGARGGDDGGNRAGEAYVVFGKAGGFGTVDLTGLSAVDGFIIQGAVANGAAGFSVSSAGDVNGDGFDDVIVGAPFSGAGQAYVVFGKAGGFGTVDLAGLSAADGFVIQGDAASDQAGFSVSSAGDVNGDGFDDLIVGARYGDGGELNSGVAYVVFGQAGGFSTVDVADLNGSDGFIMQGEVFRDQAGASVSSAGDVNGDGFDDIIVGAPGGDDGGPAAGQAYVVFGKAGGFGTVDLSALDPADGFIIQGDRTGDQAGYSVSTAGDVNGDGLDDLIVGAFGGDDGGNSAGEAYVVFGKAGGFGINGLVDLTNLSAAEGFVIRGDAAFDFAGRSVSSAGDVNGDGFDDLIVGVPNDDDGGENAGEAYVVFGKADGFGTVDLSALAPADGFVIQGDAAGDFAGRSVSSAGDVNGDGFDDLIVGAPSGDDGGNRAGEAYVIFGRAFDDATPVTTVGTGGNEILIGGLGDDSLTGGGGGDVIRSGAGDDLLTVSDLDFARIDGGSGFDTLALDGSGLDLDFTAIDSSSKVTSIEAVDLTGSGDNSLALGVQDLLQLSDETSDLFVFGDSGDTVALTGDFAADGTADVDGTTYNVYISAGTEARLLAETGVDVTLVVV